MKIWLFSDLHLPGQEVPFSAVFPTAPYADVCVVGGDLIEGDPVAGIRWLSRHIKPLMNVVYVLGNHEFYSRHRPMDRARAEARLAADLEGIHLLDDTSVTIDDVTIYGSTLWSDFDILSYGNLDQRQRAMDVARYALNDFRVIRTCENSPELWTPELARLQHFASRWWLDGELAQSTGRKVVVTHHAPHRMSIVPQYAKDPVTAAFVSDLSELIGRRQPDLWLHGHTHSSFNYSVGSTKIICNARGYRDERVGGYDPGLVIEI
jgi:Icc-related predicted phosphoesterase